MSIWDGLRKNQDAPVLSNEGFLSLQSCRHRVQKGCGVSERLSRDQSEEVTAENTESSAVTLLHKRAEYEQAPGDEEFL